MSFTIPDTTGRTSWMDWDVMLVLRLFGEVLVFGFGSEGWALGICLGDLGLYNRLLGGV